MLTSFKSWFYLSYDPNDFISIDKPPLGLWIKSLFVFIFGFNIYAMALPQVIAAGLSVLFLFILVKKYFGEIAGLLSSFILAITPMFVAVSRNNMIDMQLIFMLILSVYFLILSVEKGKKRFLFVSFIVFALGFNIKALQSFVVLPAFIVFYLCTKKKNPELRKIKKIVFLAIAFLMMLVLSFAWIFIVDRTPENEKPYVGGSIRNTRMDLTIGYNGIIRIVSGSILDKIATNMNDPDQVKSNESGNLSDFFKFEIGNPGLFRLFNYQIADQVLWLLPVILIGIIATGICMYKEKRQNQNKLHFFIFWIIWPLPMLLIFSIAGYVHRYYLLIITPAFTALAGIGLLSLWNLFTKGKRTISLLLPIALFLNSLFSVLILLRYRNWNLTQLLIPIAILGGLLSIMLLLFKIMRFNTKYKDKMSKVLFCIIVTGIYLPYLLWSVTPILYGGHQLLPFAGPNLQTFPVRTMTENQKNLINGLKRMKFFE